MSKSEKKKITFSVDSILSTKTLKRKRLTTSSPSSQQVIPSTTQVSNIQTHVKVNSARKLVAHGKHGYVYIEDEVFGCVHVTLENKQLWERFKHVGTEMVITKSGRRMFPALRYTINGLKPTNQYVIAVEICSADTYRYKYHESEWCISGKAYPDAKKQHRINIHGDSPSYGEKWNSNIVSFHKAKITNNMASSKKQIVLNSLQKYQPCLHIIEGKNINNIDNQSCLTVIFKETSFIAVTAYQSEQITQLKIDNNPFAKGFRDPSPIHPGRLSWMISNISDLYCEPFLPIKQQQQQHQLNQNQYHQPLLQHYRKNHSRNDDTGSSMPTVYHISPHRRRCCIKGCQLNQTYYSCYCIMCSSQQYHRHIPNNNVNNVQKD